MILSIVLQVHGVDGGLLIVIPSVKFLLRQLVGRIRYIGQNFQTLCWPAPVWGVLVVIALFTAVVPNFFRLKVQSSTD